MRVDCESVVQAYDRDGYVLVPNVVDSDWVERARAHIARLMREHPEVRPEHFHSSLAKRDPTWLELASDERLLDVAECFIGPNIALFGTHYICKPPGDGQPVLWHQDGSYWPLEPMDVVTIWVAIDDVDTENGCLRVIPESHRTHLTGLRSRTDHPNVLGSEIDMAVDDSRAQDCVLAAGGVEIHHPLTIHGSTANRSARWRRGLTIRYIPTTTRISGPSWWDEPNQAGCAFLLRGQAIPGVNHYLPWPTK